MKRFFLLAILMLATFASAQQADSTDILIFVNLQSDTLQSGRWRPGMGVVIRESTNKWAAKEKSLSDSLFVIIRCGIQKARIDSFLAKHPDSTSGLKTKYQLSRAALRFIKNNRDQNNIVRLTPAQLRNAFKRTNRLRHFGETQRMGIIPDRLYIKWRNIFTVATEIVVNIDTDGGAGADYSSLAAAIAGESAIRSDLVARDEVLKLMCISSAGSPDTTPVVINSGDFVTDATRKLLIQGDNNIGIWDNSKYRLIVAASICIIPNISNIQIYNMQFANNNNFIATIDINNATVSNIIINNNIFTTAGATGQGIEVNSSAGNIYLINNVLYGMRQGIVVFAAGGSVYIYNNTINATELGIIGNASATVRAKNNISNGSSDNYFSSFHVSSDYNISNLAGDAPGANSLNSTTVNFADASGGDFRLLAGSPGIDQGVDLSAEGVTTDIGGVSRPQGGAFDIGAFEFPVTNDTNTDTKKHKWLEWIKRKKN